MSDEPFVTHRSLLFTIAYEMLGSAADAEDVVQETWLRWADIGDAARDEVRDPRTYPGRRSTGCARWPGSARTTSGSGSRDTSLSVLPSGLSQYWPKPVASTHELTRGGLSQLR
jgi:hypothetical protein